MNDRRLSPSIIPIAIFGIFLIGKLIALLYASDLQHTKYVIQKNKNLLDRADSRRSVFQGYAEGDFLYISSPFSGKLQKLYIEKGKKIEQNVKLFELENTLETLNCNATEKRYYQTEANIRDLLKGRRPSEISSLTAQLKEAEAKLSLSRKNLSRAQKLLQAKAISQQMFDESSTKTYELEERANRLKSEIETASLSAREDQIKMAQEELEVRKTEWDKAIWELEQKKQFAPKGGVIFDSLYKEGEWVPAGRPVVILLPPDNIKVKAFIPESDMHAISLGQKAIITDKTATLDLVAYVDYISTEAEYTPPLIYSRNTSTKLVFLIELKLSPENTVKLHPGQPVEVRFEYDDFNN